MIIAIDLDGTLLHPSNTISAKNKAALNNLPADCILMICSARPYNAIVDVLQQADILKQVNYIGAYNGAYIYAPQQQNVISQKILSRDELTALRPFFNQYRADFHVFTDNDIISSAAEIPYYTQLESSLFNTPIQKQTIDQIIEHDAVFKVTLAQQTDWFSQNIAAIRGMIPSGLEAFFTDEHFFEIVPKGINKGSALCTIINKHKDSSTNIIAIGDQENDLSMFHYATYRVAMGNGVNKVKQQADYITDDCINDGVAKALELFFLKK